MASANGATVDGVAGDQNDEPVADAVIVAVPEARFRNRPDRYRKALPIRADTSPCAACLPEITRCSPGRASTARPYYNAEFLKSYEDQR